MSPTDSFKADDPLPAAFEVLLESLIRSEGEVRGFGSARWIEIQLNSGRPWFGTGESMGYLPHEKITFGEDGSFEIWLTPEERDGNWLANSEPANTVFVRQIYDRWDEDTPAEVHIDRIGHEGAPRLRATSWELTDLWFASLEYANRVSSHNATQALLSPDDAYYFVISREDPGHANWLKTDGLSRGVFLMRYDGLIGAIPDAQFPSGELVSMDELPDRIPGYRRVTESERAATRAARRHHIQRRSNR